MALVTAAIVPHSPVLLETIGKEHTALFKETLAALHCVRDAIQEASPDTVVVIAPHAGTKNEGVTTIHLPSKYRAYFGQFGDVVTTKTYQPDTVLADRVKEAIAEEGVGVAYESSSDIEYSASIPLQLLLSSPSPKILVVHPGCSGELKEYVRIGTILQHTLQASQKRIAIIASADLSHCLSESAPGGTSPAAVHFEKELVHMIKAVRTKKIQSLNVDQAREFGVCGIPPILMLYGVLDHMTVTPRFHSYEHPLGVGQLVMEFIL